jgi:hypothetical protein
MSIHSYSRLWTPDFWKRLTANQCLINEQAQTLHRFFTNEKESYMKINYFNAEHTHALIDLPTLFD